MYMSDSKKYKIIIIIAVNVGPHNIKVLFSSSFLPWLVDWCLMFIFVTVYEHMGDKQTHGAGRHAHALFERAQGVFMSHNHRQFAHHQVLDQPDRLHWCMSTSKKPAQEANPGRFPRGTLVSF